MTKEQAHRIELLLSSYAHRTLDVMLRLNALEKAMTDVAPRLWKKYLAQYDLERSPQAPVVQQRALRVETELDQAIRDFRALLSENEKGDS